MARRSRATGVGKGNGPGSRKGQFKDGMPSGNPLGRPKKEKETPPSSIREAVARCLRTEVPITENGVAKGTSPQGVAMVEMLFASFPRSSPNEKMRLMRWFMETAPEAFQERPFIPLEENVRIFCETLQREFEQEKGEEKPRDANATPWLDRPLGRT